MKKILLSFCSIILVLTLALSGCSCAPTTPLSFNNNFAGESGADNSFSTEDIDMTNAIETKLNEFNIGLWTHYVVTANGIVHDIRATAWLKKSAFFEK